MTITDWYVSHESDALLCKVNNCRPRDILTTPIKSTISREKHWMKMYNFTCSWMCNCLNSKQKLQKLYIYRNTLNIFLNLWLLCFFRMYHAEKLPNTNLVFLITDAKATCLSCDPRPLRQAEQPCILFFWLIKIHQISTSFVLSNLTSITHRMVRL